MKIDLRYLSIAVISGILFTLSVGESLAAAEGDIKLRALEIFKTLAQKEKTLVAAIKTLDVAAINNDVSWPLIHLMKSLPSAQEYYETPYHSCFQAVDFLRNTADLSMGKDSAERLEAREYYLTKYLEFMDSCANALEK